MKRRPIELSQLSEQIADGWQKRDAMVEANDKIGVLAMNQAMDILDEMYNTRYSQWQILGGTTDIDSIAYPEGLVDFYHADGLDEKRTQEDARF